MRLGEEVEIDFRVGQKLVGDALPYLEHRMADLWVAEQTSLGRLSPRLGDRPALKVTAQAAGPMIVGYQSVPSQLTCNGFKKFKTFVEQEGLDHLADRHIARGLPL